MRRLFAVLVVVTFVGCSKPPQDKAMAVVETCALSEGMGVSGMGTPRFWECVKDRAGIDAHDCETTYHGLCSLWGNAAVAERELFRMESERKEREARKRIKTVQ